MLQSKRALLRILINKQFGEGINKVDLFNALEEFIDFQYPEPGKRTYFTSRGKTNILHSLALDIQREGGLEKWKKNLQLLNAPVIGSIPPTRKRKPSTL